jgi:hypothetical protein
MEKRKESALSQLKYPLVFFGLALIIVESAFGAGLALYSESDWAFIVLSSWMGGLFFSTIVIVAFLVYKVPEHVMLESQLDLRREAEAYKVLRKRLNHAVSILQQDDDPKSFHSVLADVLMALEAASIKTGTNG